MFSKEQRLHSPFVWGPHPKIPGWLHVRALQLVLEVTKNCISWCHGSSIILSIVLVVTSCPPCVQTSTAHSKKTRQRVEENCSFKTHPQSFLFLHLVFWSFIIIFITLILFILPCWSKWKLTTFNKKRTKKTIPKKRTKKKNTHCGAQTLGRSPEIWCPVG